MVFVALRKLMHSTSVGMTLRERGALAASAEGAKASRVWRESAPIRASRGNPRGGVAALRSGHERGWHPVCDARTGLGPRDSFDGTPDTCARSTHLRIRLPCSWRSRSRVCLACRTDDVPSREFRSDAWYVPREAQ
jgi:hypothetical protein